MGIALYAGADLGKHSPESVAQWFETLFKKHDINAKVFIKRNVETASRMAFYASGTSLLNEPVNPVQAINKAKFLVAESKLIFFVNFQIQATESEVNKWVKVASEEKATW